MTIPTMVTGALHSAAPKVFISSTVLDLADLRSGIRYVLRQSGVNVLMSETSDFPLYGDKSACDECFENIRNSDLYVLLVDKRRGSEYEPGVSVTRTELRVARDSFIRTGRPHQLLFIRGGIPDLASGGIATLRNAGVEDPEHLWSFIKEITQPTNQTIPNFLKEFASFDDIMDSITARLNLGRNLAESIARRSVYVELTRNLAKMVQRTGEGALKKHAPLSTIREEFDFQGLPMTGTVELTDAQRTRLTMGVLGRVRVSWFEVDAIRGAIKGGVFLDYDPTAVGIIETETHQALQQVLDDVEALASLDTDDWDRRILLALAPSGRYQISVVDLVTALTFANRSENLFNTMRNACWLLSGSEYTKLPLPRLPVTSLGPQVDLEIRKERIEHWEVDQLIRQDIYPFGFRVQSELGERIREARLRQTIEHLRAIAASNPQIQLDDLQIVSLAEKLVDNMTANPGEGLNEPAV
jgi:hypothetical protein